ncbi:MAG: SUMF1/EgtB/PvdO family nonheme iron enzyme [Burkholderiales bacterium]|nr:SUMF1/EgtB/PvdO family nonheme iron enzyme [Burkholderiales bacterium]
MRSAVWVIRGLNRGREKYARYVLPPMVEIDGGIYSIGSDEGIEADEAPRHDVELAPFALAQFPVTNAEFKCFIDAGGYDDERWWDTPQAQRWRRGEGTGEASRINWRHFRNRFKDDGTFLHGSLRNKPGLKSRSSNGKVTSIWTMKRLKRCWRINGHTSALHCHGSGTIPN